MQNQAHAALFLTFLLISSSGYAAPMIPPTYRCQGHVQDKPCTVRVARAFYNKPASPVSAALEIERARIAPDTAGRYAKILNKDLTKLSKTDGVWRGRVEGNGHVHLRLVVYRSGALESRLYMGNVVLKNKSTPFTFRSSLPKGDDWSWDIEAYTT